MTRPERAAELARRLPLLYPDAHCELNFNNPLELLVATILSAQCTDKRVNIVTPALFERCRTAADYASISQDELETLVRTTGFFRSKAASIRGSALVIVEKHGGYVPRTMPELVALPGVGRKTANVVLGNAYGLNEGVVVDTHVGRLSRRLALTRQTDPVKVETDLRRLFPRDVWAILSHWLIFHGRRRCFARKPDCPACELADICPSAGKVGSQMP
jgi:endonuclease III